MTVTDKFNNGIRFIGDEGWLWCSRGDAQVSASDPTAGAKPVPKMDASKPTLLEPLAPAAIKVALPYSAEHHLNWLQAIKSGKPENIVEKMVTGKMDKFYGEACLLEQPYIRNDKQTVTEYLAASGKESGCAYTVTRFTRYKLGEGIEKKSDDFAAEVASYMK
jgi:translation elongation factor EF-Ts